MSVNISTIKNTSQTSRVNDTLKKFPMAIRQYLSNGKTRFDKSFFNRSTNEFLRFFTTVKYDMDDRDYGSKNTEITNIYLNMLNSKEVNDLIDLYVFNKFWVYHPIRKFESWNTLSNIYYNDETYYWMILIFNKITDPFTALLNFNIIRIPQFSFLNDLPSEFAYRFTGGDFELNV